ncbi:50S ribosomal protein L34e [Candidatus Bathyarchaeota archaeon]|nr:MAG: 50S ribosomal protein L34e [Candidatus Bathyarchaeota archaeon]
MPQPHLCTRSKKQIKTTVPGGETKTHYKKEKASEAVCFLCRKPLSGIPRLDATETRKLNYTKKRIWRLYGGKICPKCLKDAIKQTVRALA